MGRKLGSPIFVLAAAVDFICVKVYGSLALERRSAKWPGLKRLWQREKKRGMSYIKTIDSARGIRRAFLGRAHDFFETRQAF